MQCFRGRNKLFSREKELGQNMSRDDCELTAQIKKGTEIAIRRVFYGENSPLPQYKVLNTSNVRLIMPLSGKKHIAFASGNGVREEILSPGEVLLTRPFGWTREFWDSKHSMISIAFKEETMRMIYLAHDGISTPPLQPDAVFYPDHPQSRWGAQILSALLFAPAENRGVCFLVSALLWSLLEDLKNASSCRPKDEIEWERLADVIDLNCNSNLAREDFAAAAGIHSARLLRLVKKYTGMTFRDYLTRVRIRKAGHLLNETNLSVGAISEACGFSYLNYFCRCFRRSFHCSPGEYRERLRSGKE